MTGADLAQLRTQIDAIDEQLIALLSQRAHLAADAGAAKTAGVKFRPSREADVMRRVLALNNGPLPSAAVKAIYREIISGCLSLEQPLKISYLGPAGTYSEEAARLRFGSAAQLVPCDTLDDALRAAEKASANLVLLPVENSTEGPVNRTLDLLLQTPLTIVDEISLPIHHQLLTHTSSLADITDVMAHPQSLAQCRAWLQANLPHATQHAAASNAEAARQASVKPQMAAIAGKLAAGTYKVPVLRSNIEDDTSNTTRFVVLGSAPTTATGRDKTSLICAVANRPGSLGKLVAVMADAGINIVQLASRPSPSGLWDYVFHIDIDGHADDPHIAQALQDLRGVAHFVKVIGSYPKEA